VFYRSIVGAVTAKSDRRAGALLTKATIIVMIMTMIVVNIHDAKARLSEYLDQVAKGERVVICKRNQPIAEIHAVRQPRAAPRPIGAGPYKFKVPDSFFAPLPDDVLDAFESGPAFPAAPRARRVSESSPRYVSGRRRKSRR